MDNGVCVMDRLVEMSMAIEAWVEGVKDEAGFEYAGHVIDSFNMTRDDVSMLRKYGCLTPQDEDMLEYIEITLEGVEAFDNENKT
jgi:hypothetical protein